LAALAGLVAIFLGLAGDLAGDDVEAATGAGAEVVAATGAGAGVEAAFGALGFLGLVDLAALGAFD
jgi:hypothetical protein